MESSSSAVGGRPLESWEASSPLLVTQKGRVMPWRAWAGSPALHAERALGWALAFEENFPRNSCAGITGAAIQRLPRAKAASLPRAVQHRDRALLGRGCWVLWGSLSVRCRAWHSAHHEGQTELSY